MKVVFRYVNFDNEGQESLKLQQRRMHLATTIKAQEQRMNLTETLL